MAFVHPFDDPDVIAGQGTLGLELLEDVPDLAQIVVPVGGGGLSRGVAIAVKRARPTSGRRRPGRACAPFPARCARRAGRGRRGADDRRRHRGQAARRPHARARRALVDDVVVVGEDEVAEAMVCCSSARSSSSRAPARSASRRCSAAGRAAPSGTTVVVSRAATSTPAARGRSHAATRPRPGRRLVLFTRLPDRPGWLARPARLVGDQGANLVEVEHVREGVDLHVRETAVQLVLETRGRDHAHACWRRSRGRGSTCGSCGRAMTGSPAALRPASPLEVVAGRSRGPAAWRRRDWTLRATVGVTGCGVDPPLQDVAGGGAWIPVRLALRLRPDVDEHRAPAHGVERVGRPDALESRAGRGEQVVDRRPVHARSCSTARAALRPFSAMTDPPGCVARRTGTRRRCRCAASSAGPTSGRAAPRPGRCARRSARCAPRCRAARGPRARRCSRGRPARARRSRRAPSSPAAAVSAP